MAYFINRDLEVHRQMFIESIDKNERATESTVQCNRAYFGHLSHGSFLDIEPLDDSFDLFALNPMPSSDEGSPDARKGVTPLLPSNSKIVQEKEFDKGSITWVFTYPECDKHIRKNLMMHVHLQGFQGRQILKCDKSLNLKVMTHHQKVHIFCIDEADFYKSEDQWFNFLRKEINVFKDVEDVILQQIAAFVNPIYGKLEFKVRHTGE